MKLVNLEDVTEPIAPAERSPAVVPMPEPVVLPEELSKLGPWDHLWVYRMPDGQAIGAVARWDAAGNRKKEFRPIYWDGERFVSGAFSGGTPPLYADLLAAQPLAPVLVVEGEKTADAAQKYLPAGWQVTTWPGGASAWKKTDWSFLEGRRVVVWPDNDEAGLRAADAIRVVLSRLKIPSALVEIPPSIPEGWDLGDPLPGAAKPRAIADIIERALKETRVFEKIREKEPEDEKSPHEDAELRFRALGFDDRDYWLMPHGQQQPQVYKGRELQTRLGCLELVRDEGYWRENFSTDEDDFSWETVGHAIMDLCEAAGVYTPENIRNLGVWSDDGRTVLHKGDELLVDGIKVNPAKFRSKFIYPVGSALFEEWGGLERSADDELGRSIREACNLVRWERPIYGDLLAGFIATAPICGALPWRTHCWITGNAGSGKTTVVNEIAGACLGDLALYPAGASTEAGIRQVIGNDARPVVFDESESTKNKEDRREAVIQLMRQSSSETRGRIMKGSANHRAVSFTLRSAFLMSSIGVGLKEAADLTRTAILTVRPLEALTIKQMQEQEKQWKEFMAACARIPANTPQALLARQVNNLPTIRKNIGTFKEVISVTLGNGRLGDQLGTLLAGCYSLFRSGEASSKIAEAYLENYDWDEFTTVKTQREDLSLLFHMMAHHAHIDSSYGVQQRQLGELLEIVMGAQDQKIPREAAWETLCRYGIRWDETKGKGGVWIGLKVPKLHEIMQSSPYFEGWSRVLQRHPYAEKSNGPLQFMGIKSIAIFLPRQEFQMLEG